MNAIKRFGALALSLAMSLSLLSGCGPKAPASSAPGGASEPSSSGSGDASASQEEMDLSQITDPCLAVAGLDGGTVVATAGGEDITAGEVLYWLNRTAESYLEQFGGYITEVPWDIEVSEGVTLADQLLDSALETAAGYHIFHLTGAREGFTPDPAILTDADREFAQMAEQLGGEEIATHMFWSQLLTRDLLVYLNQAADLYQQLQALYFGEGSDGYPTDAEVMAWLDQGGYFRVKHILLMTVDQDTREPLDEETVAQKKAKADDLLARLRSAEDPIALFDTLMQENSEDGGLATNPEGYVFNAQDSLVGGFREATLALDVGDISDVVETDYGYHIMLRLPLDPADYRARLVSDRMQEKVDQWTREFGVEKTDAFDRIDPAAAWTRLTALQNAVYQELQAAGAGQSGSQS